MLLLLILIKQIAFKRTPTVLKITSAYLNSNVCRNNWYVHELRVSEKL